MKRKEIEGELCEKHQLLKQTDHIPLKLQEAQTYATSEQFEAMKERYKTVVQNRQKWRERISELEEMVPEPDDDQEYRGLERCQK